MAILSKFSVLIALTLTGTTALSGTSSIRTVITEDLTWKIDPTGVRSIETHDLVTAIAPRLVEWNMSNGQIVAGLAEAFYWNGNELNFKIRKGHKSPKGDEITSDDVIFSLERLFKSKDRVAMPGRLDQVLCITKSGNLVCNNIVRINDHELKMIFPSASAAYVDYLTDPVYSIVLRKSVDNRTGKIEDLANYAGRYHVRENSADRIVLAVNKNHWGYRSQQPAEVIFIRLKRNSTPFIEQAIELLKKRKIDYIGVSPRMTPEQFENLKETFGKDASYYTSDELNARFLLFTNKGMKLPKELRQTLSKLIQKHVNNKREMLKTYKRPTIEFLAAGSYGSFRSQDFSLVEEIRSKLPSSLPQGTKIKIGIQTKFWQDFLSEHLVPLSESLEFVPVSKNVDDLIREDSDPDAPDLIPLSSDITTVEAFQTIGFFVDRKIFNIRNENEGIRWIKSYTEEKIPQKRVDMYRQLHFDSVVTNPSIIPLYTSPFRAFSINGWKIDDFPNTAPGGDIWTIRK
jgi:ABC-type transport system substrate-binding protein